MFDGSEAQKVDDVLEFQLIADTYEITIRVYLNL